MKKKPLAVGISIILAVSSLVAIGVKVRSANIGQYIAKSSKQADEMAASTWFVVSRHYEENGTVTFGFVHGTDRSLILRDITVDDYSAHWGEFAVLHKGDSVRFEVDHTGAKSLNPTVAAFLRPVRLAKR